VFDFGYAELLSIVGCSPDGQGQSKMMNVNEDFPEMFPDLSHGPGISPLHPTGVPTAAATEPCQMRSDMQTVMGSNMNLPAQGYFNYIPSLGQNPPSSVWTIPQISTVDMSAFGMTSTVMIQPAAGHATCDAPDVVAWRAQTFGPGQSLPAPSEFDEMSFLSLTTAYDETFSNEMALPNNNNNNNNTKVRPSSLLSDQFSLPDGDGPEYVAEDPEQSRRPQRNSRELTSRNNHPFVCHECPTPRYFDRNCELRKHLRYHARENVCTEPGCGNTKGFGTARDLERHRRTKHGLDKEAHYCLAPGCKHAVQPMSRKDNAKRHMWRKHGIRYQPDGPSSGGH